MKTDSPDRHVNIQAGAGHERGEGIFCHDTGVMSSCPEDQSCRNLISQYYSHALSPIFSVAVSVVRISYLQHQRKKRAPAYIQAPPH